jgi:hypothetical protein
MPFINHGNMHNYEEPKPFSWAKPTYINGFFSSNFTMYDHILNTIGAAFNLGIFAIF